jgi:HEAT repeat protein
VDYAELVLDYIRALVWPALVVFVAIRFRGAIGEFLRRIAGESQEISVSGFGLGITATLQQRLETLAEQSETAAPAELKESVQRVVKEFNRDQFHALTGNFTDLSQAERHIAVRELARLSESMELEEMLTYVQSPQTGERVAAAIGLGVLLKQAADAADDPGVLTAIQRLLSDPSSFVRYRAVEALLSMPTLISRFETELRRLARSEKNRQVRELAHRALERIA